MGLGPKAIQFGMYVLTSEVNSSEITDVLDLHFKAICLHFEHFCSIRLQLDRLGQRILILIQATDVHCSRTDSVLLLANKLLIVTSR